MLNWKLVHDSGDKYTYLSYLDTELNYNTDAKQLYLQSLMYFFREKPGTADNTSLNSVIHFSKTMHLLRLLLF